MEFCPEVAVLEAAFQLVSKQARQGLSTIDKTGSQAYTPIIDTAVHEICAGLESDRSDADASLWKQNIHTLILYSLVQKRYTAKDEHATSKTANRVPVYSSLDILVQTVPDFSCHFYFEIIKLCSWEPMFFECLHLLDCKISVPLLHDAIQHMTSDPVTPEDEQFIAMVTDKLLSGLLCVPAPPNPVTEKLLLPLRRPRRFVRRIYSSEDEEHSDTHDARCEGHTEIDENSSDHTIVAGGEGRTESYRINAELNNTEHTNTELKNSEIKVTGKERHENIESSQLPHIDMLKKSHEKDPASDAVKSDIGITCNENEMELVTGIHTVQDNVKVMGTVTLSKYSVWGSYFKEHSDIITVLLEHMEAIVSKCDLKNSDLETLLGITGKLLILGLIQHADLWVIYHSLVHNLWGTDITDLNQTGVNEDLACFCLNIGLSMPVSDLVDKKQWAFCVYKVLTVLLERFGIKGNSEVIDLDDDKSRHGSGDSSFPFETSCETTVIENRIDSETKNDDTGDNRDMNKDEVANNMNSENHSVEACSQVVITKASTVSEVVHDIGENTGINGDYVGNVCNLNGDQKNSDKHSVITEASPGTSRDDGSRITPGIITYNGCQALTTSNVNIVGDLHMDIWVMLRMLEGCLSEMNCGADMAFKVTIEESLCLLKALMDGAMGSEQMVTHSDVVDDLHKTGGSVVYAQLWREDVSLSALCWRIQYRISPYQECVDQLMSPRCLPFWTQFRLYEVLQENTDLLAQRGCVLRLIAIRDALSQQGEIRREITPAVQRLTTTAFTELPFHEQDRVVTETYISGVGMETYTGDMGGVTEEEATRLTAVFNRITAERDDEILSELLLMCLRCPTAVLRTAVDMCARNDEQATNLAQVLQYMYEVCRACHPALHADSSLICRVISDHLTTASLSEKEQGNFNIFVQIMMKPHKRASGELKAPVLAPAELLHTILPYTCVTHLLENRAPVSCKLALTLMKSALETGCNKHSDWSDFQPMEIVLCLAELLQECLVLWDGPQSDCTGFMKISVRQLAADCLVAIGQLVRSGFVTVSDVGMEWFLDQLQQLHWLTGVQVAPLLHPLSPDAQLTDPLTSVIYEAARDLQGNLVPILLCVGLGWHVDVAELLGTVDTLPTYEDIITALIQVLPNLLAGGFVSVTEFVCQLLDACLLPVCYRLGNTAALPLADLSDVTATLGMSQLLRDAVITLASVTADDSPMLQHTLQGYVTNVKVLMERPTPSPDLRLFVIGQLFQHVCDLATSLPSPASDPALVLLLHLLTEFKVNSAGVNSFSNKVNMRGQDRMKNKIITAKSVTRSATNVENVNSKIVKCLTIGIEKCVQSLPDETVEKAMLIKKLEE